MRTAILILAALSLTACATGEKTWAQKRIERREILFPDPVTTDDIMVASASRRQAEGRCGPLETKQIRDGYTPGDYRCRPADGKKDDRRRDRW